MPSAPGVSAATETVWPSVLSGSLKPKAPLAGQRAGGGRRATPSPGPGRSNGPRRQAERRRGDACSAPASALVMPRSAATCSRGAERARVELGQLAEQDQARRGRSRICWHAGCRPTKVEPSVGLRIGGIGVARGGAVGDGAEEGFADRRDALERSGWLRRARHRQPSGRRSWPRAMHISAAAAVEVVTAPVGLGRSVATGARRRGSAAPSSPTGRLRRRIGVRVGRDRAFGRAGAT